MKLLERRIEGLQIVPAYRKKSTEVEFVVSEGVAGVPPGSVLVSIDGIQGIEDFEGYDDRAVPVSELRKHYYQWFSRGSSRYALDQGFATWLTARHSKLNPVPTDGDVHTYRFRSGGQKEIELKAKWLDFNPDKSSGWHPICTPCKEVKEYQDPDRFKLVFRRLNYCIYRPLNVRENVAIVHMFTFDYPDGNEPLKNCCEKKKHDLPKNPIIGWRETDHRALVQSLAHVVGADGVVIFDLRRTGGGTFDPELIGKFTPMPYKIHTKSFYYSDNFPDPTAEKKWKILRSPDANLFIGQYPESRPMSLSLPAAVRYIQDSKRRAGQALFSPPIPFFCKVNCSSGEADYQGVGDPHRRVVAILGPPCSSACDQFASLLVDNGIARSYGMPTAGASSPYRLWVQLPLKSKALVKIQLTIGVDYRPNTRRLTLDGNPVEPDVLVLPRSGDDGGPPGNYLDLTLNEIYQDLSLNAK